MGNIKKDAEAVELELQAEADKLGLQKTARSMYIMLGKLGYAKTPKEGLDLVAATRTAWWPLPFFKKKETYADLRRLFNKELLEYLKEFNLESKNSIEERFRRHLGIHTRNIRRKKLPVSQQLHSYIMKLSGLDEIFNELFALAVTGNKSAVSALQLGFIMLNEESTKVKPVNTSSSSKPKNSI